jgi:hypothetical protein
MLGFAVPFTSLSKLYINAGAKTILLSQTGMFGFFFIQF